MKTKDTKKLIFASSSSIYGNNKKTPFSESDRVDHPISPYAFTKKSCELLNHAYHSLYDIDIINLRFFTVYGPRQRPDLAIRKFVDLIKNNKSIPVFGDGKTGRDYTYIEDIVDGIVASIRYVNEHRHVYEIINLGNHNPVSLQELVSSLYHLLGKKENIEYLPMQEGDVDITFADISKAKRLLNYSPRITLQEGLKKFIEWHDTN
jgi:UDP-glucuronate 4-epimerase